MTKHLGLTLGTIAFIILIIGFHVALPGCGNLTPKQKAVIHTLADIGLKVAVDHQVIAPGDSLLIGGGVAILTSADKSRESQIIELAHLGINEAVKEGVIKEGDSVLIKSATEAIVLSLPPLDAAPAAPSTGPPAPAPSGK